MEVLTKKNKKRVEIGELMEISRSKWDNFIKCPLCFYLKEKHNIDPPETLVLISI